MVDTQNRAFRHPTVGRIFPDRPFTIGGLSYPANWLELATDEDLISAGITVSDNPQMTPEDLVQEDEYQQKLNLRDHASKEQFEFLGRYVQAFELMIDAVRTGCVAITTVNVKQQRLMNIIFHYHGLSANGLFEIFRAMIAEILLDEKEKLGISKDVCSDVLAFLQGRYGTLLKERNDTLHATWNIGWYSDSDVDFSQILMRKGKTSSAGLEFRQPVKSVGDLKNKIEECKEVEDMIRRLWGAFLFRDSVSIEKQFKKDGKGWIRA